MFKNYNLIIPICKCNSINLITHIPKFLISALSMIKIILIQVLKIKPKIHLALQKQINIYL